MNPKKFVFRRSATSSLGVAERDGAEGADVLAEAERAPVSGRHLLVDLAQAPEVGRVRHEDHRHHADCAVWRIVDSLTEKGWNAGGCGCWYGFGMTEMPRMMPCSSISPGAPNGRVQSAAGQR